MHLQMQLELSEVKESLEDYLLKREINFDLNRKRSGKTIKRPPVDCKGIETQEFLRLKELYKRKIDNGTGDVVEEYPLLIFCREVIDKAKVNMWDDEKEVEGSYLYIKQKMIEDMGKDEAETIFHFDDEEKRIISYVPARYITHYLNSFFEGFLVECYAPQKSIQI